MKIKETLRGAMRRIAGVSSAVFFAGEGGEEAADIAVAFHFQLVWAAGRHHAEADGLQPAAVFGDSGAAAGDQLY